MRRPAAILLAALLGLLWPATWAQAAPSGQGAAALPNQEELPTEPVPVFIERMAKDDFGGLDASRRLAQIGKPAVPALIQATGHEVPRVRYWSIAALSSIGDERAIPAIAKLLDDPDGLVRAVAVWHMGRWSDLPEVRESVLKKLDDRDAFVQGWALRLVQVKEYKEALPQVRNLLKADTPEVRYDALHTLAVLEGPAGLDTMTKVLEQDGSPLVRECALRCCTIIKPPTPRTAELLIQGLRDKDEQVRSVAAKLLRQGFGQDFGFDSTGKPLEPDKAAREWKKWYEANKAKLRWNEANRRFETTEPAHAEQR